MVPSVESALPVLVVLVKATGVLGVAVLASLLLQRSSAGVRHVVWLTALAGVLVLPMLAAWTPVSLRIIPSSFALQWDPSPVASVVPQTSRGAAVPAPAATPAPRPGENLLPDSEAGTAAQQAPAAGGRADGFRPGFWQMALAAWALVALALLGRLALGALAVRRIVRRAVPADSPAIVGTLYEVADRIGLERTPRVLISGDVAMPFASGLLSATIVLPESSGRWSGGQMTAVLIHELAHIRRRDLIGHTIGRIACALYWFHPMVWMAARRLRDAGERACDDLALELGTVPSSYAEHLLDLVMSVRDGGTPAVAMALAHRREFEGRMLAILDPAVERRHPTRRQTAGLAGILALLTVMLAATAPAETAPAGQQGTGTASSPVTPTATPAGPGPAATPPPAASPESSLAAAIRDRISRYDSAAVAEKLHRAAEAGFIDDTIRRSMASVGRQRDFDRAMEDLGRSAAEFGVGVAGEVLSSLFGSRNGAGLAIGAMRLSLGEPPADPKRIARLLLEDPDPEVRSTAAWGLEGNASDREVVAALARAVTSDRDARVRTMAAWSMSSIRSSEPVEPLGKALSDQDPVVREMAAWALGVIGEDEAAERLGELLAREQIGAVQVAAAWALGSVRPERAPSSLGRLMASSNAEVVTAAAWAVAEIGDRAMQSEIVRALQRPHEGEALDALIRAAVLVGVEPGSVDYDRMLSSDNGRVRRAAARMAAGREWATPWPWPWPRPIPFPW